MAATSTTTTYDFNLSTTMGEANSSVTAVITADAGMTDAAAIALQRAWLGLPWPAGASASAYCTKHDTTDQMTDGNPTTGTFA